MLTRGSQSGFVLMAALWLLVALAAVGLDAALRHRTRRLAAGNLLDGTRLRGASVAGAEYARSRLTSAMLGRADQLRAEASRNTRGGTAAGRAGGARGRTPSMSSMFRSSDPASDPWRDPSGLVPAELEWNGVTMQLNVRDTGAALNLNGADDVMLQQFFSLGIGLDYKLAMNIAEAIADFRDADDIPRLNGGEREQYLRDGAAVLPANHAFTSIDELRFVKGMTDEIFATARPFLRVSTATSINVNAAPEEVLLALPGMNREGAAAIVRQRRAGNFPRNIAQLAAILPQSTINSITAIYGPAGLVNSPFARRIRYATDQVEITAEASIPGNPVRSTAQIVVERALNGAAVTWRRVE